MATLTPFVTDRQKLLKMGYKPSAKLHLMGFKFSAVIGSSNLWQSQTSGIASVGKGEQLV